MASISIDAAGKPRRLLVSGVPAAGKSHFCRWLAGSHGFVHIDVDHEPRYGTVDSAFANGLQTGTAAALADLLPADRPAVVDWGFPVVWLDYVAAMKNSGFSIWWFDADVAQSRKSFVERSGLASLGAFNIQMGTIQGARERIVAAFAPNVIATLTGDGLRLTPEEISERMGIVA